MIDNIKDKIIHILVKIPIGINHDSKFIVEELLRNMLDFVFIWKKNEEMKNKKYTSFDKCSSFFSYWISPAEDLLLIKKCQRIIIIISSSYF